MLSEKNVLLGVCGSIAAYKAASLVRLLVQAGARVKVIMTPAATHFISPLTLSTLSGNPALSEYYDQRSGLWNSHVDLGLWADVFVIAPASANSISKLANGACDNLLSAVYLSARCDVCIAPAMDLDMWKHPAVARNIENLKAFGNLIIEPAHGQLASGLNGQGRMQEPEMIVDYIAGHLKKKDLLKGKRALVTAGPTYEALDPVRFIGNHSSGKMGHAIAEELAALGASVTLVTGPTGCTISNPAINVLHVKSAEDMYEACAQFFPHSDISVFSAAVADYRPEAVAKNKLKKKDEVFNLRLLRTRDILASFAEQKRTGQILVGFALETDNEETNAIEKLQRKNLDFIVLNSMNDVGAGFQSDTNKVTIIDKDLNRTAFGLKSKALVAKDICSKILEII